MPHETTVIHKMKEFLTAPLPGGGKRWHVAALCVICFLAGKFF